METHKSCWFFGILFCLTCVSQGETDKVVLEYTLVLDNDGWEVTALSNGIPILLRNQGGGMIPMTYAVRDGENELVITAKPKVAAPEDLEILVIRTTLAEPYKALSTPVRVFISHSEDEAVEKTLSWQAAMHVEWPWESSDPIDSLSKEDESEIKALLTEIHKSLLDGDMDKYFQYAAEQYRSVANHYGISEQEVRDKASKRFEIALKDDPSKFILRTEAELRIERFKNVVHISGPTSRPLWRWVIRYPISQLEHVQQYLSIGPLLLIRKDGVWAVMHGL